MSETYQDETQRSATNARALTHFINGKTSTARAAVSATSSIPR